MNHFILSLRSEFAFQDLKKCLSTVHLREVSSQQLRELQKQKEEQEEQETGWWMGWLLVVCWLVGCGWVGAWVVWLVGWLVGWLVR